MRDQLVLIAFVVYSDIFAQNLQFGLIEEMFKHAHISCRTDRNIQLLP